MMVTSPALAPDGPRTSISPVTLTLLACKTTVLPWAAICPLTVKFLVPKSNVQLGPEAVRVPSMVQADAEQQEALPVSALASQADRVQTASARDGMATVAPTRATAAMERRKGRRGRWGNAHLRQGSSRVISTTRRLVNARQHGRRPGEASFWRRSVAPSSAYEARTA